MQPIGNSPYHATWMSINDPFQLFEPAAEPLGLNSPAGRLQFATPAEALSLGRVEMVLQIGRGIAGTSAC